MDLDVLSTPGHLISLAARGFARLSEARLKPLGFRCRPSTGIGRASGAVEQARNVIWPASPRSSSRRWRRCSPAWSGTG